MSIIDEPRLHTLIRRSRRGQLSRRQFMQGVLALGMSVPAATALWTNQVAASTPKKGGTLRAAVGDASVTDTLDPATANAVFTIQLPHIFRTYLTEVTPENGIGPDSAESWEVTPDAKVWRFKLAKGQEFHNGKPLTSKDVVASLNHHRSDESTSGAKALLADVESVEAEGDDVVVVKLSAGTADMPSLMADYHLAIMPDDGTGKADALSGVGAGPYKLNAFRPGEEAEFTRYDNYHRETYFDAIQLIGINDATARVNALMTDAVDVIADPDPKIMDRLKAASNFHVDEVPSGTQVTMDMNCTVAPFDNVDVRLALKYAFDRRETLAKVALGYGTLGNDHPIASNIPYYAALEQREYDAEKARYHLKKAGVEGLSVQLSLSDPVYAGAINMGVLYRESAAKAGINIDLVHEPIDSYWSNVWLKKPFVGANYGQRATPDMVFSTFFRDGAPWNSTRWSNSRFQELLVAAKSELDDKKRAEMYREMQQLCRDDGGTIVAFFQNFISVRHSRVSHNPSLSSEWQLDGGRAYHRWWFNT